MARKQTQTTEKATVAKDKANPDLRFAVIGAGSGGLAFAGHLALKGYEVTLYNRSQKRIEAIRQTKTIQLVSDRADLPQGRAHLAAVTSNLAVALENANVVMVVVDATAHEDLARRCAPHLREHHFVLLNPGRTGGALSFAHSAFSNGCDQPFVVAEAQTLAYTCRATNPGQVRISGLKNSVPIAAIPANRAKEFVKLISEACPEFVATDNVMKTSMENIGSVFHPAIMVLNASRIESSRGDFEFYVEGVSRSVATILEKIDRERVEVAAALGFGVMTAREWLYVAYGAVGRDLHESMRANEGYYGIKAPSQLLHKYLMEDVPSALVPIASLGRQAGCPCPTIEGIIHMAGLIAGCDFWATGRTAVRMGLAGLSAKDLRRYIVEGPPASAPKAVKRSQYLSDKGLSQED